MFADDLASLPSENRERGGVDSVGGTSVGEFGSDAISGSGSGTSADSGDEAWGSMYSSEASFRPLWARLLTSKVPAAKVGTISTSSWEVFDRTSWMSVCPCCKVCVNTHNHPPPVIPFA